MASDLLRAVERLRIGPNKHDSDQSDYITGTHSQQKLRRRAECVNDILMEEMGKDFLTPKTSFDARWLDKLQQYDLNQDE